MKSTTLAVAVAAILVIAQSAQARERYSWHGHHHIARSRSFADPQSGPAEAGQFSWNAQAASAPAAFGYSESGLNAYPQHSAYRGGDRGRPAAWCGWEMRRLVGSDPGPSYNLARNWAHWGRSGPVGVGAVVVWPHHVGKIVGQQNGEWVIESGNDGHALRTRPRSIAGAIAIRWG
ncbi:MAG TPA: hypothetical protein VKS24_00605 [Bradyrhizobium sp.]|nr:hypothetical protein [Bradyrhizobium sp.]